MIKKNWGSLKMIIIGIVTVLLISCVIIGFRIYKLGSISSGELISEAQTGKALVILDIQNDTLTISQYKDSKELMTNINQTISDAKELNIPVIYSKQEFKNPIDKLLSGGMYQSESGGAKLSNELSVVSNNVFSKTTSDLFSSKEFETFLIDNEIGELYLAGADASSCVLKTTLAALNRKYKVIVLEDCLFSVNKNYLNKALTKYEKQGAILTNHKDFRKLTVIN